MNATRTAKKKMDELALTEEQVRRTLEVDTTYRLGAEDIDTAYGALQTGVVEAQLEGADTIPEPDWKRLDFPVELHALHAKVEGASLMVPKRRAIVREDTNEILNIVSDRYKLVKHRQVFEPMHEAVAALGMEMRGVKTNVGLSGGYARVEWIFGEVQEITVGDGVVFSLVGRNSYNYEAPLGMELGAFRLVCSNGLMAPVGGVAKISRRHLTNLKLAWFLDKTRELMNQTPQVAEIWSQWAARDFTAENLETWLEERSNVFSKKARAAILEKFQMEKQKTLWHAYNAITWYATHRTQSREDRAILFADALQKEAQQLGRAA